MTSPMDNLPDNNQSHGIFHPEQLNRPWDKMSKWRNVRGANCYGASFVCFNISERGTSMGRVVMGASCPGSLGFHLDKEEIRRNFHLHFILKRIGASFTHSIRIVGNLLVFDTVKLL
jgi:hypothetical protein